MKPHISLERLGFQEEDLRDLFLLSVETPEQILPAMLTTGTSHFVSFIAWDAVAATTSSITRLARTLLDAGCVYFCCWGPGCERVHDLIDEEYLQDGLSVSNDGSTIMTSWHDNEPIDDALWFAMKTAYPDDRFFDNAKAVVAVCIGSDCWSARVASAFADPVTFSDQVLNDSGDAA